MAKKAAMTAYDFQVNYATWVRDKISETTLMINPLHNADTGSFVQKTKDGLQIGGEYILKEIGNQLIFNWGRIDYLVSPNEEGFDLLIGETVKYSFTRIP